MTFWFVNFIHSVIFKYYMALTYRNIFLKSPYLAKMVGNPTHNGTILYVLVLYVCATVKTK